MKLTGLSNKYKKLLKKKKEKLGNSSLRSTRRKLMKKLNGIYDILLLFVKILSLLLFSLFDHLTNTTYKTNINQKFPTLVPFK